MNVQHCSLQQARPLANLHIPCTLIHYCPHAHTPCSHPHKHLSELSCASRFRAQGSQSRQAALQSMSQNSRAFLVFASPLLLLTEAGGLKTRWAHHGKRATAQHGGKETSVSLKHATQMAVSGWLRPWHLVLWRPGTRVTQSGEGDVVGEVPPQSQV